MKKPFLYRLKNRCFLVLASALDLLPSVLDLGMRVLGPVLVLGSWAIFLSMHYVYYWHIVPALEMDYTRFPFNLVTLLGYALYGLIMYTHCMAVFTPPGSIPQLQQPPADIHDILQREAETYQRGLSFTRHCRYCLKEKPARAHHCHVCRQCVLRFDHHCPWIAGCVGYHNYRYFFLFMLYLWLGAAYIVALTGTAIFFPLAGHQSGIVDTPLFISCIVAVAALCGLSGMLVMHSYLLLTNQTTLEMYVNGRRADERRRRGATTATDSAAVNAYDVGVRRNVESIMGRDRTGCGSLLCCLIPCAVSMPGTGMWFETKQEWTDREWDDLCI